MMSSIRKSASYLIYTTEEGGDYHILPGFNNKHWKDLLRDGFFLATDVSQLEEEPRYLRVYPAFAELVGGIDNRDFVVEERLGKKLPPEITEFDILRKERYED